MEHTESIRERDQRLTKKALELFEQCKGSGLTVKEFYWVLEYLKNFMENRTIMPDRQEI